VEEMMKKFIGKVTLKEKEFTNVGHMHESKWHLEICPICHGVGFKETITEVYTKETYDKKQYFKDSKGYKSKKTICERCDGYGRVRINTVIQTIMNSYPYDHEEVELVRKENK
jgi:DnaJ-class molecular chaperone